jgi:hypothetical protein
MENPMTHRSVLVWTALFTGCGPTATDTAVPVVETDWSYAIVDSDQLDCYDVGGEISCPAQGEAFHGQDAQYLRAAPSYDSDGEIVIDNVTGLVWQWEQIDEVTWDEAQDYCAELELGGISSWRVPTVKESYSLMQFDGSTGHAAPEDSGAPDDAVPYIDDEAFDFAYGSDSERYIDTQFITTTTYVSTVFSSNDGAGGGTTCFFGTNLADGRIKCYPDGAMDTFDLRCVAGNEDYGINDLEALGDGSIADHATGLQWMATDSGGGVDWQDALAYCEDLISAGYDDWRLPDAKELQSIVDYGRSPDTTGSAAIDPLFEATPVTGEDGYENYGWYWTSTTHLDGEGAGVYVAFGEATGQMEGEWLDVHGAGAQRSDPKAGDPDDYPVGGQGPQGDVQRVFNLARCVRDLD